MTRWRGLDWLSSPALAAAERGLSEQASIPRAAVARVSLGAAVAHRAQALEIGGEDRIRILPAAGHGGRQSGCLSAVPGATPSRVDASERGAAWHGSMGCRASPFGWRSLPGGLRRATCLRMWRYLARWRVGGDTFYRYFSAIGDGPGACCGSARSRD